MVETVQGVPAGLTAEPIQGVPPGLTAEPVQQASQDSQAGPVQGVPPGLTAEPIAQEKPGMLKNIWDKLNTGLVSKDTFVRALTGLTPQQLDDELSPYADESPTHAAFREFTRGTLQDIGATGSSFTSPLAIGTMAAGSATKLPGAIGTLAKATTGVASATFAGMGAKDVIDAGTENTPEAWQQRLQGAGMAVLGTEGAIQSRTAFRTTQRSFDAASKLHNSAKSVFDQRMQEVDVATKQASQAAQDAEAARQAEEQARATGIELQDPTGAKLRQHVIESEEKASAAASNARKAQEALKQAGATRAETGLEVDRLGRKLQKSTASVSEKQTKEAAGAREDFKKAIPPAPRGKAAYTDRDLDVVDGYLERHHKSVEQVDSVRGTVDGLDYVQHDMENQIAPYREQYRKEPITRNVRMDVREQLAENPRADFVEKGMKVLENYDLTDPTLEEADIMRKQLNSEIRGRLVDTKWDIGTALDVDPEFAAKYHALDSLRNGEYDVFEDKGVKGIRELRQDEASVIKVRNAAMRQLEKGNVRVRGSNQPGLLRKTAAWAVNKGGIMAGAKFGGPTGAFVGDEMTSPTSRLGRAIYPDDLTRDQLIQRRMKVSGVGVPITEILGNPQPASQFGPPDPVSPRMQMFTPQREMTPLHSELATHYGERFDNSSYWDLEQRFMDDIGDKQRHGVPLENAEKTLLGKINQANAADALAAQKQMQELAAQGKTATPQATLPDSVEPLLQAPDAKLDPSMDTHKGIVHDMAHIVVGQERGVNFRDGIRSHLHNENVKAGSLMSAPIDWSDFTNEDGEVDLGKIKTRIADLAATYVAGGVANDLYHDIPFTENQNLGADISILKKFIKGVGFSEAEASKMISQAADDAALVLSRPGTQDVLEQHAAVRESGLDERYHVSPERMEQILQDLKGTTNESNSGNSARDTSGTSGERHRTAKEAGAGTEGKSKEGNPARVRQEGQGPVEGKGGAVREDNGEPNSSAGSKSEPGLGTPPEEFKPIVRPEGGWTKTENPKLGEDIKPFKVEWKPNGKYGVVNPKGITLQEFPTREAAESEAYRAARQSKEVQENNPKLGVPPERTTGEHDDPIKKGGGIPGGIQKGDPEIGIKDLVLFHAPTGSTLALHPEDVTPENVAKEIAKSNAAFAEGETRKAAATGPVAGAADEFNRRYKRPAINTETHPHDIEFAKKTADAFDEMQHNPDEPKTKAAYDAMKKDIDRQWRYATQDMGVKFEPWEEDGQPYRNSKEMVDDVKNNKHLYFFQGGDLAAGNPLAEVDPKTGFSFNDKFRAVHDLFGHAAQGNQFGPKGEEVAYQLHRQMFTPEAIPALTSETRGQNSWVNFGKHLRNPEGNIPVKGEPGYVPQAERPFGEQKTGLLPEQFHQAEPKLPAEIVKSEPPYGGAQYHPELQSIADKFGTHMDPSKTVGKAASFIAPDGKYITLPGGMTHDTAIFQANGVKSTSDNRVPFLTDTKAIRLRSNPTDRSGPTLHFSVPAEGISPQQIDSMKQSVAANGRYGNVLLERADVALDKENRVTAKEFATPKDIEPMLREIQAHPESKTEDLNPKLSPKGSSVPLMKNPLKIEGTAEGDKVNTLDVAKALNQYTKNKLPALELGKAEGADQVKRAKSLAEDEAKYQLAQNNTGAAWYTKEMGEHDQTLKEMRPEINTPAKLSIFKMVEAVLSSGQKPYANFKSAVKAWDHYHETGDFPPQNPDTNMSWGPRGVKAYSNAIDIINRLIKEKGEQGASDWLLSDHTIKELREYNNAKRGGGGGGVAGKLDDVLPGTMVLGPKRGPFAQNLHGQESAFTADMWVARSWNRWMGTIEHNSDGEITTDSPRNAKERELMKESFQKTADKLKLTTSSLQAVLWYYEQGLYDVHGAKKESWSFSDAAKRAQSEEDSSFNFGDNVKHGADALAQMSPKLSAAEPQAKPAQGNPPGMVKPGNINLSGRPVVKNDDGTHSSEYSVSMADDDGHEVLVPTMVDGKFLTPDGKKPKVGSAEEKQMFKQAWDHYKKTGQHLGVFDTPEHADQYAQIVHNRKQ